MHERRCRRVASLRIGADLYFLFLLLPIYWLVNMCFKTNARSDS